MFSTVNYIVHEAVQPNPQAVFVSVIILKPMSSAREAFEQPIISTYVFGMSEVLGFLLGMLDRISMINTTLHGTYELRFAQEYVKVDLKMQGKVPRCHRPAAQGQTCAAKIV